MEQWQNYDGKGLSKCISLKFWENKIKYNFLKVKRLRPPLEFSTSTTNNRVLLQRLRPPFLQAIHRGYGHCVHGPISIPTKGISHHLPLIGQQLDVRHRNVGARDRVAAREAHWHAPRVVRPPWCWRTTRPTRRPQTSGSSTAWPGSSTGRWRCSSSHSPSRSTRTGRPRPHPCRPARSWSWARCPSVGFSSSSLLCWRHMLENCAIQGSQCCKIHFYFFLFLLWFAQIWRTEL